MPRRREVPKREVPPDPLYSSTLVTKFVRMLMRGGKRSVAEGILYGSLDIIQTRTGDDPLKIFKKAVDNTKPSLEVKSRRVGGSNYQVPIEVATQVFQPCCVWSGCFRMMSMTATRASTATMSKRLGRCCSRKRSKWA